MRTIVFLVGLCSVLLLPELVSAQVNFVPCGGAGQPPCEFCHLVEMGNRILAWLILVLTVVAGLIFAVAGLKLVTSGGNPAAKDAAKSMFTNVIVGYLLVLASWLIVDTLMKMLGNPAVFAESGKVGPWNRLECSGQPDISQINWDVYTDGIAVGTPTGVAQSPQAGHTFAPGTGVGSQGSCEIAQTGPCSAEALQAAGFGGMASAASQIAGAESGCNPNAESRTDTTTDGRTYSVGTWQINLAVHPLNCTNQNGQTISLNCPAAFQSAGTRNRFNVREQIVINEDLYTQCVAAAKDPSCNNQIAANLANNSGDLGDWACSAKKCDIATSRNHLCPL